MLRLEGLDLAVQGGPLRFDRAPSGFGLGALLLRLGVAPLDVFEQEFNLGGALANRVLGGLQHRRRQS